MAGHDLQHDRAMGDVWDRYNHLAAGSEQVGSTASDFPWVVEVLKYIGKEDIVEFLKSLTDESFVNNPLFKN